METIFEYISQSYHMWAVIGLIICAMVLYALDKVPLEITSILVFSSLLAFFHFFPLEDSSGNLLIDNAKIFAGFANPALISVIGLLIVGQAVVQTGALNEVANIISKLSKNNALVSIGLSLIVVMVISAILNNTPVVVIFIPILITMAKNMDLSVSKVMIPLSYAAILGGMVTLIGSSTNLLVSGTLEEMGLEPLSFFEFSLPGGIMATVGFIYVLLVAPKLLPDRASFAKSLVGDDERQFIAQLEIDWDSEFVGKKLVEDKFEEHPDLNIRMIQRGGHAFLPPYDEHLSIRSRDVIVISATRKNLADLLSKFPRMLLQSKLDGSSQITKEIEGEGGSNENIILTEVVVTPTSRMIGQTLEQIGLYHNYNAVVLGIQRESRIIRARVSEIKLAAGDVLLVMAKREDLLVLRETKDLLLLEWSTEEIQSGKKAKPAAIILSLVVSLAALDIVPIAVTSFVGATVAIITGCLNFSQAKRAIDSQVVLIVAASLALGAALQATGGAEFLANKLISMMSGASPIVIMSALFLMMVGVTNVLSNNASAVLFTPIAVEIAQKLNMPPSMFIFAVIFACNCSFVTPIGYQTNLLVMGPGHHKFSDYIRSGLPLAIIMWITYTLYAIIRF